jgi:hypothetical protein
MIPYNPLLKPPLGTPINKTRARQLGLVGFWLMNEGSGSILKDLSGNGNNMALASTPPWKPARFGPGVDFTALEDIGTVASSPSIDISGDQSGIIWVKFDTLDATDHRLMCKRDAGGTQFDFYIDDTNALRFYEGTNVCILAAGFVINKWYQIAFTVTNGVLAFYINGVFRAPNITAISITANDATLKVGGYYTASRPILGVVDHVMFFNQGFSASEIALLYREPFWLLEDFNEDALLGGYQGTPPVGAAGIMTPNTGYWGPTF